MECSLRHSTRGLVAACLPIPKILLEPSKSSQPYTRRVEKQSSDDAGGMDDSDGQNKSENVAGASDLSPLGPSLELLQAPRNEEGGDACMHCTVCNESLGKKGRSKKKRNHPLLNVPICSQCLVVYESGDFLVSEEDGHEIYCRWCGDGGDLVSCDACICSFCTACIERNFGAAETARIKNIPAWACFVCSPAPLVAVRARFSVGGGRAALSPSSSSSSSSVTNGGTATSSSLQIVAKESSKPYPVFTSPFSTFVDEAAVMAAIVNGGALLRRCNEDSGTTSEARDQHEARRRGGSPLKRSFGEVDPSDEEDEEDGGGFRTWVVTEDISCGRERNIKIRVVNEVDDFAPPPFTYVAHNVESPSVVGKLNKDPDFLACCDCTDGCMDPHRCAMLQLSGGSSSYSLDGLLMEPRQAIYECNVKCRCNRLCPNRVVGRGIVLPLEVFRCTPPEKGWGVRCRKDIPQGSFIACYHGELLAEDEVEMRGKTRGDEYLFNLDMFANDAVEAAMMRHGFRVKVPKRSETADKSNMPAAAWNKVFAESASSSSTSTSSHASSFTASFERYLDIVPRAMAAAREANPEIWERKAARRAALGLPPRKPPPALAALYSKTSPESWAAFAATNSWQKTCDSLGGRSTSIEALEQQRLCIEEERKESEERLRDGVLGQVEGNGFLLGIDAKWWGNIGRFFNHSCAPNMEKICVFTDSHDIRVPSVAFFTTRDVFAGEELTYNYGYVKGSVEGKQMICRCGEPNCVERMY